MSTEHLTPESFPEGSKPEIRKFTLSKLVAEYNGGIRIPMIQRDYAQGRPSWVNSRNRFLSDIRKSLMPEEKPLHLDFVYGIKQNEDGTDAFCPLDGQQRLTTLFLLHWYLAARDGCFSDFQGAFRNAYAQSKFTYQVRPGGRSFFQALVEYKPFADGWKTNNTTDWIRQQSWFRTIWERDPSVAGALEMINSIHEHFKDHPEASFRGLMQGDRLTFQGLDLEAVGLHDDLYLRMNARGRPLSSFETFKARYEKHLESNESHLARCSIANAREFSQKIDGKWLDFIWERYGPKESDSDDTSSIDAAFINLFRAVALASLPPRSDADLKEDTAVTLLSQGEPDYDDFEREGWIGEPFTVHLVHVLEALTEYDAGKDTDIFGTIWFGFGSLLDRVVRYTGKPDLTDHLQFAVSVRFLSHHGLKLDDAKLERFKDWMRVTRNLITNSEVRAERFRQVLSGLEHFLKESGEILPFLSNFTGRLTGIYDQQLNEERRKAMLIQTAGWGSLIEEAENHGYFRGQIDFLLEFSGANAGEVESWTTQDHCERQRKFASYHKHATGMFDRSGFKAHPEFLWERAFLAITNFFGHVGECYSFLNDDIGSAPAWKQSSWKRLLRDNDVRRRCLQSLWDRMPTECLEDVAASPPEEPWRKLFCSVPSAWAYCGQRLIRCEERAGKPARLFLLSSKRRSAAYAELFTYCLMMLEALGQVRSRFAPLEFVRLVDDVGSSDDDQPHLMFELSLKDTKHPFLLYCQYANDEGFSLWTPAIDLQSELLHLMESIGFVSETHGTTEFRVLRQQPGDPLNGVSFLESFADSLKLDFIPQPS